MLKNNVSMFIFERCKVLHQELNIKKVHLSWESYFLISPRSFNVSIPKSKICIYYLYYLYVY